MLYNFRTEGPSSIHLICHAVRRAKSILGSTFINFNGEIGSHFPGRKDLDGALVLVSPQLVVCLDCGFTEFAIPESELRRLAKDESTG